MAVNGSHHHPEPTLGQLVNELVNDAILLLRQELALAKHEIYEEARKTKTAVASLGVGTGIAAVGGLLFIIMLVHLLNALTELPLWICYGIVGGVCAIAGFALIYSGKHQLSEIDMVPQQTIGTMRENVRWFKNRTTLRKI